MTLFPQLPNNKGDYTENFKGLGTGIRNVLFLKIAPAVDYHPCVIMLWTNVQPPVPFLELSTLNKRIIFLYSKMSLLRFVIGQLGSFVYRLDV